jgi:uncharacterized protein YicC (UPF0701 family)
MTDSDRPTSSRSSPLDPAVQAAIDQLKDATRSVTDLRPNALFSELDRKVGELHQFQRNLEPVKVKVEELIQVVGGRRGYADLVKEIQRLNRRVSVLSVSLVALIALIVALAILS